MKKTFRVAVATMFALVFAVATTAAFSVSADDIPSFEGKTDLAQTATPFADELYIDGNGEKPETDILNDDLLKYWQAQNADAAHYVGLAWDEAQVFDTVVIQWGGGRTDFDSLSISAVGSVADKTQEYDDADNTKDRKVTFKTDSGADWSDVATGESAGYKRYGTDNDDSLDNIDVISLSAPVSAKMLKITISGFHTSCNVNYCGEIVSVKVYKVSDAPVETPDEPSETPSETPDEPSETPSETPDEPSETPSEPSETPSETPDEPSETPSETPSDTPDTPAPTGVESVAIWVVIFAAAAAAVVFATKKVKA